MGSVGIFDRERCACGHLVWPGCCSGAEAGNDMYCLPCTVQWDKARFISVLQQLNRGWLLEHCTLVTGLADSMCVPSIVRQAIRKRKFLRHHFLPHGYVNIFAQFTYAYNGRNGNVSETMDIVDVILSFV
jgi:hypothetical protein